MPAARGRRRTASPVRPLRFATVAIDQRGRRAAGQPDVRPVLERVSAAKTYDIEVWLHSGAGDDAEVAPLVNAVRSAIGERIGSVGRVTGGDALVAHVVAVNGELVGGWKRTSEGKNTLVTITLPVRLSAAERRRIDAQGGSTGKALGNPVGLTQTR